jgi:hypothetical protein
VRVKKRSGLTFQQSTPLEPSGKVPLLHQETIELEGVEGTLHQVPLNTLSDKDIFRAVAMDLLKK